MIVKNCPYHDLFSELASEDSALNSCVSSPPPVSIAARTVLRLALAEADPDIALEPDVVAGRELERIEARCEDTQVPLVLPLSKDGRVRGAPVIISHLQEKYLHSFSKRLTETLPGTRFRRRRP